MSTLSDVDRQHGRLFASGFCRFAAVFSCCRTLPTALSIGRVLSKGCESFTFLNHLNFIRILYIIILENIFKKIYKILTVINYFIILINFLYNEKNVHRLTSPCYLTPTFFLYR